MLFVVTDAYRPAPQSAVHAFCHVLPNLWHQMSVMLSAASCLQWFCRLTGTTEVALLEEIAELSEEEKSHAPFFLPISPANVRRTTILTRAACSGA